jgi:2-keto-4-pentenoate hydratase/2-oxohepta-3-ene-1,7-dioic acid hydratase in catechol pathway
VKLATFGSAFATELGLVLGDEIISLTKADTALPREMAVLISQWERFAGKVADIATSDSPRVSLSSVRLRQPILRPGKILALGKNYAEHAKETGSAVPDKQIWFCKQVTAANGPNDPVDVPRVSEQVDYEAELVVVIGKGGRHIAREDALAHVFGYACGNDVSVRDWQKMTAQWMLGKSFDTHAPFGPWITTADEVPDPQALDIKCHVNGEVRQSSNTSQMIFQVADQIALLSQVMTLEPGDVIFTGTPEGVAMGMSTPVWLKAGDRVQVEIKGLGALDNLMRAEP